MATNVTRVTFLKLKPEASVLTALHFTSQLHRFISWIVIEDREQFDPGFLYLLELKD